MSGLCPIIKKMKNPVFDYDTGLPRPGGIAAVRPATVAENDALVAGIHAQTRGRTPVGVGRRIHENDAIRTPLPAATRVFA